MCVCVCVEVCAFGSACVWCLLSTLPQHSPRSRQSHPHKPRTPSQPAPSPTSCAFFSQSARILRCCGVSLAWGRSIQGSRARADAPPTSFCRGGWVSTGECLLLLLLSTVGAECCYCLLLLLLSASKRQGRVANATLLGGVTHRLGSVSQQVSRMFRM